MKALLLTVTLYLFSTLQLHADDLRVSTTELLKSPNKYKVLDVRNFAEYQKGHIPNAINFPVTLTYADNKLNGKLTDPFSMQNIVQNLGLYADDTLVIYGDGSFFDAARLFWALEVYGFKNVKLLNSGYDSWSLEDYPTTTQVPNIVKSDYITIIDSNRIATKFSTQIATKNPNQIIIDARPPKAYKGEVSSAKRFGHIPKALNIPASHNINSSTLKEISELQDVYKDIPKKKKIILYCAIGKISATNYFALRELGYNVSNYDASWKEWGNDFQLPVVNPSKHIQKIFGKEPTSHKW